MGGLVNKITGADDAATAQRDAAALSNKAMQESTEKNIDFQKWLWGQQKDITQPFVDAGSSQITPYQDEVNKGFNYTVDDFYKDPGYQFGMNEGAKMYGNSGAAKGMQLSGKQAKDLTRFGQDYAGTKFNQAREFAYKKRQSQLDNLYRMIAMGSNAAGGQATMGGDMGRQISNSIDTSGRSTAQMYSDWGNIEANQALAPWNFVMDAGNLAAEVYGNIQGAKGGATGGDK